MALLTSIKRVSKPRQRVHKPVECGASTFEHDGVLYLQLDTYGTRERQDVGDVSQSLQMDREAALQLRELIDATFAT